MKPNENSWKVGEKASFPWKSTIFKKSGTTIYKHFYSSSFICIREEDEGHRGILLKVIGRTSPKDIIMVGGEPFCKDEKEEMIVGKTYSSYRFPTTDEVTDVVEILRGNPELLALLDKTEMHVNPQATFWVRESARSMLLMKKPQFYDVSTNKVGPATDSTPHYRLTLLYFNKGELIW